MSHLRGAPQGKWTAMATGPWSRNTLETDFSRSKAKRRSAPSGPLRHIQSPNWIDLN
ncbi:hypothetical protein LG3211_2328 [Lysobacter gummosus]|nr:hypothetical protein LG3211_2328 [Lysobacter gummosus]